MYQNARTQFVQTVAEQATRPQNIETLQNAGEPAQPEPQLSPSIQAQPTWPPLLAPSLAQLLGSRLKCCRVPADPSPLREPVAERLEEAWCHFHLCCSEPAIRTAWKSFSWMGIYPNQTQFILVPFLVTL